MRWRALLPWLVLVLLLAPLWVRGPVARALSSAWTPLWTAWTRAVWTPLVRFLWAPLRRVWTRFVWAFWVRFVWTPVSDVWSRFVWAPWLRFVWVPWVRIVWTPIEDNLPGAKYAPLALEHLRRNRLRTFSTVMAMALCIFLFCTLQTVLAAVNWALEAANASRLVTRHALSLVNNLPLSHQARIASVPGVRVVATTSWFGGSLPAKKEGKAEDDDGGGASGPDFSNFFENFAVEEDPYFAMYPEYIISPADMQAFKQDLQGCLIGRGLADKYGWKAGDRFFLESFIPPYRRRSGPFEFVVRGIYETDPVRYRGTNAKLMFFHYKYLWEGTGHAVGAGTYTIQIADPEQAGAVSKAIDEAFENSDNPTKTETEAAFAAGFASMAGNLAALLNAIGLGVAFTILLVTANTMSMAVRERRTEIAVLKTLGFSSATVMALVMGESLLLGALGGGLGLALSALAIQGLPQAPMVGALFAQFPHLGLSAGVAVVGFSMALFIGLAAGFVPALLSYRARIVDMLRQV